MSVATCPDDAQRRDRLFALMRHITQLGTLLPALSNLAEGDAALVAETRLVIAEMAKTTAEVEALVAEQEAAQSATMTPPCSAP